MKRLLIFSMELLLNSCAYYRLKSDTCELKIISMREVKAADLVIDKDCQLVGNAKGMKYNEMQLQIIQTLVNKVP